MKRSGWLTFSSVVLILTGIMRFIDGIWALTYRGALPSLPDGLSGAVLGGDLRTYGWIWLITGIVLAGAGVMVLGPSKSPEAEVSRWVGIVAASLGALSAIVVVPYYPVWALIYIVIAVLVIYGLAVGFKQA